eukprot:comp23187_c0_seq1/m.37601 comp23187_c0_seq1/g.37601  ORF comp23187_c0_seq1/g.37601 comp23187_c0_seq1/m.37601 type:complete len:685 (-) comp23187_c0_seq1:515-2569(-)
METDEVSIINCTDFVLSLLEHDGDTMEVASQTDTGDEGGSEEYEDTGTGQDYMLGGDMRPKRGTLACDLDVNSSMEESLEEATKENQELQHKYDQEVMRTEELQLLLACAEADVARLECECEELRQQLGEAKGWAKRAQHLTEQHVQMQQQLWGLEEQLAAVAEREREAQRACRGAGERARRWEEDCADMAARMGVEREEWAKERGGLESALLELEREREGLAVRVFELERENTVLAEGLLAASDQLDACKTLADDGRAGSRPPSPYGVPQLPSLAHELRASGHRGSPKATPRKATPASPQQAFATARQTQGKHTDSKENRYSTPTVRKQLFPADANTVYFTGRPDGRRPLGESTAPNRKQRREREGEWKGMWEEERAAREQMEREWASGQERVVALEGQVVALQAEKVVLVGEIETHRGTIHMLEADIEAQRGTIHQLEGKIATHRGTIHRLEGKVDRANRETETHRKEIGRLKDEAAERGAVVEYLYRAMESITAETQLILATHDTGRKGWEEERTCLQAEIGRLEGALGAAHELTDELGGEMGALAQQKQQLANQVAAWQDRANRVRECLGRALEVHCGLHGEVDRVWGEEGGRWRHMLWALAVGVDVLGGVAGEAARHLDEAEEPAPCHQHVSTRIQALLEASTPTWLPRETGLVAGAVAVYTLAMTVARHWANEGVYPV